MKTKRDLEKEIDELKVRVQYLELRQPQYIQVPCPLPHYPAQGGAGPFTPLNDQNKVWCASNANKQVQ